MQNLIKYRQQFETEIINGDNLVIRNNIRREYLNNVNDVVSMHQMKNRLQHADAVTSAILGTMFESYGQELCARDNDDPGFTTFRKALHPMYEEFVNLNVRAVKKYNCHEAETPDHKVNGERYMCMRSLLFKMEEKDFKTLDYESLDTMTFHFIDRIMRFSGRNLLSLFKIIPVLQLNDSDYGNVHFDYEVHFVGAFFLKKKPGHV